ncbi:hypothetical protein CVS40_8798 [Lucilia cuprina]|nr:hypothetical protein CVS40_8798 [Lucilia cuprina]
MGNLPKSRVTISAPFQHVGRGQKSYKGYIAVFVCMTTKTIHLEAVSDLTSEAFLAALKRFFGRRGVNSDIYSDSGTNFVGANKKLDKDFKAAEYLTTLQQRNKWKFPSENLKEGTVVLIKDENTHPASWPLARITEVHSGKDGKVRVATLKLANSSLKRPISKLCPLVSTDTEEENSAPAMSCVTTTKPEKKKLCWLQFILMMLMIMNPVKALPINMNNVVSISNLSANTALYLDKVGQLNAINSKWNLVVYYDLSLYYQELERIGKLMGKVREECPKLNLFKDSCEMVMSVMERRYKLLDQNNELLSYSLWKDGRKRSKADGGKHEKHFQEPR